MTAVLPTTGTDVAAVTTVPSTTDLRLDLDPATGLLRGLRARTPDGEVAVPVGVDLVLQVGGHEQRHPTGGLSYRDVHDLAGGVRLVSGPREDSSGVDAVVEVVTDLAGWTVTWSWTVRSTDAPAVSLELLVEPPEHGERVLRDVLLTTSVDLSGHGGPTAWRVDAPGNVLRPHVVVADLPASTGVSPAGGLRGSSALVRLSGPDDLSLAVWSYCRTEEGAIALAPTGRGVAVTYDTTLGGEPPAGGRLRFCGLHLDLRRATWAQASARMHDWYRTIGVTVPPGPPAWARSAAIWEAQVGFSVFRGGHRYAPYPTVDDLIADLDRVAALGFDTVQLMPRQPYPSYNVHDYADVDVSYGPEERVRELVRQAHARGMKVILDVLLHGVLDQGSITAAADGVRSGPYADRLDEDTGDSFSTDPNDHAGYDIAWSRHIIDFEPHWVAGSPPRSPLLDEHPDWFFRDSAGEVMGVYTRAFDARNTAWQDWFIAAMVALVERLDVDGFRFDAPSYNSFANWSPATRHRASASTLACVPLFRRLRPRLKALSPELLMYTEPSGVVLRESMDLNYNYDEQWLVTALLRPDERAAAWSVTTARDLLGWLRDRDAHLPTGSATAHHIDSHDTFWWPAWGAKWRREQFGEDAVRAVSAVFLLCDGPFMMFTGGEAGIEDLLGELTRLKRELPSLRWGRARYDAVRADRDDCFVLLRSHGGEASLAVVNLADHDAVVDLSFDASAPAVTAPWRDATATRAPAPEPGPDGGLRVHLPARGHRVLVAACDD
jgi:hypothetical protein